MKLTESFLRSKRRDLPLTLAFLLVFFFGGIVSSKADDRPPIRMGYLQADLHQLPAFISLEKKLYERQGLTVEVAGAFKAGPEEMTAFAANSLDFGFVGVAPATVSVANRTSDVKVIAQVNNEGSGIVVRRGPAILNLKDLVGRMFAIPGYSTVQDVLVRKALIKEGIDFKDLKMIVLKPPEMLGAMETNQVDAFIAWEPFVSMAVTRGLGKVLLASHDIWPNHPCCVLVAQKGFLTKDREGIKRILKAHVEAIQFIKEHPAEAVEIGIKYTGVSKEVVQRGLGLIEFTWEPNVYGMIEYTKLLNGLRYITVEDPRKFVDELIDATFIKEILSK
jgi:NitT/TauT family transport system substrate-binding protein